MPTMKQTDPMQRRADNSKPRLSAVRTSTPRSRDAGGCFAAWRAASPAALATLVVLLASGPVAAQSVIKLGQTNDPAKISSGESTSCGAGRYHAAFATIRDGEYQAVKNARESAAEPDLSLPGRLIFTPVAPPKSNAGRQALISANQLARSQNRPGWMASTDSRWVMKEVTNELGRYLGQDETKYLCGGVPDYLKTLRSYLARFGGDQKTLEALEASQAEIASNSILSTRAALRPVPLPTPSPGQSPAAGEAANDGAAPAERGDPMAGGDLRPAVGMRDAAHSASVENVPPSGTAARHETATDPDPTGGTVHSSTAGADGDLDLPPLTAPQPIALASDADRLAALDSLIDAARRSGALTEDATDTPSPTTGQSELAAVEADPAADGSDAPADAGRRPVLARLAGLRPLVYGSRSPIADVAVRRQLIDSFSAIEILDYLDHRPAESADSLPAAIGRTLDAISEAHAKSCSCAGD